MYDNEMQADNYYQQSAPMQYNNQYEPMIA